MIQGYALDKLIYTGRVQMREFVSPSLRQSYIKCNATRDVKNLY